MACNYRKLQYFNTDKQSLGKSPALHIKQNSHAILLL